jgi:HEAT repeat protein
VNRDLDLAEAAARAQELADAGDERELANLRREWDDEVEGAARDSDYRIRAVAYRAIGQFRYRQKLELLQRGLEDESPACRGTALLSLELLSRESPGVINSTRRTLHELIGGDPNGAVRRLGIVSLKNGPPARETIAILRRLADSDDEDRQLRDTAQKIAAVLTKKANVEANARRSGGR